MAAFSGFNSATLLGISSLDTVMNTTTITVKISLIGLLYWFKKGTMAMIFSSSPAMVPPPINPDITPTEVIPINTVDSNFSGFLYRCSNFLAAILPLEAVFCKIALREVSKAISAITNTEFKKNISTKISSPVSQSISF